MRVSFLLSRKRKNYLPTAWFATVVACMVLVSCDSPKKKEVAFINGRVNNPKQNTVVFTDYDQINDTVTLSATNEFTLHLKPIKKAGLYTFWHANEYQSLYLEPGDSITIFVDTKSFDESLSFSNNHARENNYLINLFVAMEAANKSFLPHYKKEPAAFVAYVDRTAQKQLKKLAADAQEMHFSDDFVAVVTDLIWFNYYSKKERYVAAHYGSTAKPCLTKLPKTFYDHREHVDLTNVKYLNNYAFKAYVNSLIANRTREQLATNNLAASDSAYASTRLHTTSELLKNETMRELFLSNYTRNVLRNAKDHKIPQTVLKTYLDLSTHEVNKNSMLALANSVTLTRKGNDLADLLLQNVGDNKVMLGHVVKKPSVIYYWSTKDDTYSTQVHLTVADLRKKYPEFEFIGINTDEGGADKWKRMLHGMAMDTTNEYKVATENSFNLNTILKGSKRAMLIDKDLTIIDGNLNLLHYKIETTLLGYASK